MYKQRALRLNFVLASWSGQFPRQNEKAAEIDPESLRSSRNLRWEIMQVKLEKYKCLLGKCFT
jgi:hypothetical protein